MDSTNIKWCINCGCTTKFHIETNRATFKVYDEDIEINAIQLVCDNCKSEMPDEASKFENYHIAKDLYRMNHNIFASDAIDNLCAKFHISLKSLSDISGISLDRLVALKYDNLPSREENERIMAIMNASYNYINHIIKSKNLHGDDRDNTKPVTMLENLVCPHCGTANDITQKIYNIPYKIKDEYVNINAIIPVCNNCGHDLTDPFVTSHNRKLAKDEYKRLHQL